MNIVITGSTRGLGLAAARQLLSEGHSVTISSESAADVTQTLERLESTGLQARGIRCDVSVEEDVRALVLFAREGGRDIDAWVNNAGIPGVTGRTDELPVADLMNLIDVNIRGTCVGSVHALRAFQQQGHGRLMNVIGRGAKAPVPFANAYGPSKTWIRSFTLGIAHEIRGSRIAACTFDPGLVRTDLTLNVRVVRGHEQRIRYLGAIQRFLGNEPEVPGKAMAKIVAGRLRNGRAYHAPVLMPALGRLFSAGSRPEVQRIVIEPERDRP